MFYPLCILTPKPLSIPVLQKVQLRYSVRVEISVWFAWKVKFVIESSAVGVDVCTQTNHRSSIGSQSEMSSTRPDACSAASQQ